MKFLKRIFEMVVSQSKTLNEVFALVPDSFQQYATEIRDALRESPPEGLGGDDWLYLEALIGEFPDQVLVECYKSSGGCTYYLYDVSMEDGEVKWANQREVEVEAALKVKSAMETRMNEVVEPPQTSVVDVSDANIIVEETEGSQFASVQIAQKAEIRNRNNRIYPREVLEDAVTRLKDRIAISGPIPMETMHRDERFIGDVCAIIHEVNFDAASGVVTLPKIEILDTTSGQNIKTLLEAELQLQVSQRGLGISHEEIDPDTGMKVQIMDWLEIQGWDMVWNGDASVAEAVLTLNEEVKSEPNESTSPPETVTPVIVPAKQSQPRSRFFSKNEVESPPPPPAPSPLLGKEVLALVQTAVAQAINPLKNTLETETKELRQKEFMRISEEVVDTILAKHPRFNQTQKDVIKKGINVSTLYSQVESLDIGSITRVLTPVIEEQISQADKLISTQRVSDWGLPEGAQGNSLHINTAGSVTFNEVINDAHVSGIIDAAEFNAVSEGAIDMICRNDRENNWVMPLDHPGMKPLAMVMDNMLVATRAKSMFETGASSVGVPVTQVSMLLVPTVWRMITAFQVSQLHPMSLMVEDIPIERWAGQQSTKSDWEKWDALDPGDKASIPESVLDYEYYRLAAGYQPQHVRVTPRARAITKNTVMNPTMRSTALAAREIVDQNDTMLWRALIMEAMKFESTQVSTWTALTRVGTTDEYTVRSGIIPFEWVVRHDSNKNVAKSGLIRNFPADNAATVPAGTNAISERTLEPLALRAGTANTALNYLEDYTVDWVKGTISLTAAGRAKASVGNGVEAKYSFATNFTTWDATVPSGSTFLDHLVDLRFKIADARTKIKNRHYEPECVCWNYGLMDKVSAGKNFTYEGGNPAQVINMMSEIMRYAGSDSIDSTAIPEEYVIVTQKMSILFGMHTPFTLTGQVITDETGDRRYFGEQFAGSAVPAPEKVSIVGVQNVP